jgi:hypothetical protein
MRDGLGIALACNDLDWTRVWQVARRNCTVAYRTPWWILAQTWQERSIRWKSGTRPCGTRNNKQQQTNNFLILFLACYVSPPDEFDPTNSFDVPDTEIDSIKFCRDDCKGKGHAYFNMYNETDVTKCHCIDTKNSPKGGFIPETDCDIPTCTIDQVPVNDSCHTNDTYMRSKLFRYV